MKWTAYRQIEQAFASLIVWLIGLNADMNVFYRETKKRARMGVM
jgi:hypothetical protein